MADLNSNTPQSIVTHNKQTTTLSYPGNIKSAAFYCTLTFKKYNRRRPSSTNQETITASIILPVPDNFGDRQDILWNGDDLGLAGTDFAQLKDAYNNLKGVGQSVVSQLADGNGLSIPDFKKISRAAGIAAMAVTPKNMRDTPVGRRVSQEVGVIQNPHLVAQFEGVPLRQHTLEWRFSPHNEQDAKTLGNIINQIRMLSLPSYTQNLSRFTLDYPDTVEATFTGVDTNFKSKIFKSGITAFATDYATSGLAFYKGGRPVECRMMLGLTELEINTREDFANNSSSSSSSGGNG